MDSREINELLKLGEKRVKRTNSEEKNFSKPTNDIRKGKGEGGAKE